MPSEAAEHASPNGGNTKIGQSDSGHLAVLRQGGWPA